MVSALAVFGQRSSIDRSVSTPDGCLRSTDLKFYTVQYEPPITAKSPSVSTPTVSVATAAPGPEPVATPEPTGSINCGDEVRCRTIWNSDCFLIQVHHLRGGVSQHDQAAVGCGTMVVCYLQTLKQRANRSPYHASILLWSRHAATCNIEGVSSDLLTFLTGDMQGFSQNIWADGSDGGRRGCQYLLPAWCAIGLHCLQSQHTVHA